MLSFISLNSIFIPGSPVHVEMRHKNCILPSKSFSRLAFTLRPLYCRAAAAYEIRYRNIKITKRLQFNIRDIYGIV